MKSQKNKTMIIGRHPVLDAISGGSTFERILIQKGIERDVDHRIKSLCKQFDIPTQSVPKEKLNRIYNGNHQGVIGFLSLVTYYKIEDVLPTIYEKSEIPLILILDGITDVRNFGAIARTAEVCGVQAIVVPDKGTAQINPEALKASAGALTKILVCREKSLTKAIETIQLNGIKVFASSLATEDSIFDLEFGGPTALVIGSEGDGVSNAVLRKVDQLFKIPQKGSTDSLNVSVATGMMLYEVMRQRQ
jgi:23S rRNA (guanosine2251-2'-O)-methyltransferase